MNFRFTLNNTTEGEYVLPLSPVGWDETELAFKRSDTFKGLFYEFTTKLKFFCGAGKEYIDNIYDTQGVEADVTILIEIDCTDSGIFETAVEGLLNLSTYQKTQTAPEYTIVGIEQAGIEQIIKSRYDTTINLNKLETIDGTALEAFTFGDSNFELELHSKEIIYSSLLSFEAGDASSSTGVINGPTGNESIYVTPFLNTIKYDDIPGISIPDQYDTTSVTIVATPLSPVFQNTGTETTTYLLDLIINGETRSATSNPTPDNYTLILKYKIGTDFITASETVIHNFGDFTVLGEYEIQNYIVDFSDTFNVVIPANQYLWVYFDAGQYIVNEFDSDGFNGTSYFTFTVDCASIKLSETTTTEGTQCKAFAIFEAGARLAQSITNQTDAFRSDFFGRVNAQPFAADANGCGSFTAITNGFQLRGFPISDEDTEEVEACTLANQTIQGRPIYDSLKNYFESLSAIYNLGLGIEKDGDNYYIRIEPIEYFYSLDVLFQIPNIKNFRTRSAEEFYLSGIEVGFDKWESEQITGLDEVCTKREYTTKLRKNGTKISKLSKYVAGSYPIEFTRRKQFVDGSTEDYKFDQENFIICLNRDTNLANPTTAEKNEHFNNITNLISPETTYNLRLTPGRIVRNWYKTLAPSLIKLNTILKDVKFAFGQGNYKATSKGTEACDFAGLGLVDESADLVLGLPTSDNFKPLFEPEFIECEVSLTYTQFNLIKANPTKCLEVSPSGVNFIKAFIYDCRYSIVKGTAKFILLKAYDPVTECSNIYVEESYIECGYIE